VGERTSAKDVGSSFVKFRGRGFWAKDTPPQVAMFGISRAIDQESGLSAVDLFRNTLQQQMVWGGTGCVYTGIEDFPDSDSVDSIVQAVEKAIGSISEWLTAKELTRAKVAWGGFESAPQKWNWNAAEADSITPSTRMVLAAFLELLDGTIQTEYGQLVYSAESEDAHARMIPGGDWRAARAQTEAKFNELLNRPPQSSSFGPDVQVRYKPLDLRGTTTGS
jgi:hypothetical protein